MEGIIVQALTKEGNMNNRREHVTKCAMLKKVDEECTITVEIKKTSVPDQEPRITPMRSQIHKCAML